MIDFHCHLDLYPDPHGVARQCDVKGLHVLSVTTTPSAWRGTRALAAGAIKTALGLHPQLAHERRSELLLFDTLLSQTDYVGEIGLDGSPEFRVHWHDQLAVFTHILRACVRAGGRIMSIHSRRASQAVLDSLEDHPNAGIPVLHWFSGSVQDLHRAIDLGCWFSVGPPMLGSHRGRWLISLMPRERILTESDGPFVQIGSHSAMPWDVNQAEVGLAELWGLSMRATQDVLSTNFLRLTRHRAQF